jgi:diguanylate cyclase (GGDEF)-like protein
LHLLSVLKDITEDKRHREWLEEQAFQDNLTGLGNRAQLFRSLEETLHETASVGGVAVLFLDLDDFKLINDSLGHPIGDWVLQVFAGRLRDAVPEETIVVRLGGDEFALVFCGPMAREQAERSAGDILHRLEEPFLFEEYEFHITASIGIAANIASEYSAEDLLRDADTAMYVAKSQGKGGYQVFTKAMYNRAVARFGLQADMRKALADHHIVPFYQPIIRLDDLTLAGYEALARWRHPERGLIMPAQFIPVAEESGLITSLGMVIMDAACAQAGRWRDLAGSGQTMSINVSYLQFRQVDLVNRVTEILDRHGLEPGLIKIEITESGIMEDAELSLAIMAGLKKLGVRLQIDDFGTGYSSLSYLRRIPAESVKVDRSFVIGMEVDMEKQAIVRTIIDLARSLGMNVIAEGVETMEQLVLLRSFGCQYGQGFLFDEPLPPEKAEQRRDYSWLAGS